MSEIRPQFFLVRENDTIVPLIALDELPADITISGVARTLGMADTGGMTSVGQVPSRGVIYVVNGVSESNEDRFFANGKVKGRFGNKKTGVPVDGNGRKIYCSYWLRSGDCMFEQQGCLYKHIMPKDPVTLRRCGFSDIPVWYQKRLNVPSLHRPSGIQKNWRENRGARKAIENNGNGETVNGKGKNMAVTPQSPKSVEGEATAGALIATEETTHGVELAADQELQPVIAGSSSTANNNGGANPVTPPSANPFVDFERVGPASFAYKYDAPAPQTPNERLPMRSRRLFEARAPNNDYTPWEEPRGRFQKKL